MIKIILWIIIPLAFLAILYCIGWIDWSFGKKPLWGVTFSETQTTELGIDWRENYLAILDELKPSLLRLVAYWEIIEPEENNFDFQNLDWQISEAQKRNIKVLLALGHKVPRWPECHQPSWVNNLDHPGTEKATLKLITTIINRYKDNSVILGWQIENEPLWPFFGNCPPPDKNFLKQEIALAKALDPGRPVTITDSGELSFWTETAKLSEVLGTTMYRIVWHKYLGFLKHYYYTPLFYRSRAEFVKKFFGVKKVIVAELQAEPWASENRSLTQMPIQEQYEYFSVKELKRNLEFARRTGLPEIYLWGAEWAWWVKTKHQNNSYWEVIKAALNR